VGTFRVASGVHDVRQLDEMRRDRILARQIRVAQLYLDPIAQRRKHIGEYQHLLPLWIVTLYRRRLALNNNKNHMCSTQIVERE